MNHFSYETMAKDRLRGLREEGMRSQATHREGLHRHWFARGIPRLVVLFLILLGLLNLLSIAASGVSSASAEQGTSTDAIAGTWYGNMHLSVTNAVQRIKLVIPAGCKPGEVCGTLLNYAVQCTWEITYDGFSAGAYQYHFSDTLKGGCPAGSGGSLTLMPDGTLYRVHQTPQFTATGSLGQLPNQ